MRIKPSPKIRNPKHEILNKFKCPKSKIENKVTLFLGPVHFKKILFWYLKIVISILFRISIFDIRI